MNKNLFVLCATAMLFMVSNQAKADVIYDTISSGYNNGSGWTIGYPTQNALAGDAFTPSADYTLTSIEVVIGNIDGTNGVNVDLLSNNGGQPGSLIEAFSFSNLENFGQNSTLLSANSTTDPILYAGDEYWLVASPTDSTTWDAWDISNTNGIHASMYTGTNGWSVSNSSQGAFQIDGNLYTGTSVVPEPASLALLAIGLAGLFFLRKRLAR